MKILLNLLILLFIFVLFSSDAQCKKYYCPNIKLGGIIYSRVYDTESSDIDCNKYKNLQYKECLLLNKKAKEAYKSGRCFPVKKVVHNFGTTKCEVELNYEYKQLLGKHCSGSEPNIYMKKLDSIYSDFN